jgi:hypothetical protein
MQALITSGYHSGDWTGSGITTSAAAALAASAHKTALGIAEAADLFSTFPASFSGQSVDASAVLVRYTASGDANLDGTVDTVDFNSLAANFGAADERWVHGDFNYDASIDTTDFNLLAANFGFMVAGDVLSLQSLPVPEPSSFLLTAGSTLAMRRRRHRRLSHESGRPKRAERAL